MKNGLSILWAALIVITSVAATAGDAQPSLAGTKPNIIFIFSDDHAAQSIGAYGAKLGVDVTPCIDKLAAEGMRFNHCMCGNSLCGPSRASVLTGKFSHANGYAANQEQAPFDGSQPTLPKYLKKAGYETAIFGKWHLESNPTGFDDWKVLIGQGFYYNPDFVTPAGRLKVKGFVTDITTDMALNWLNEKHDPKKPFLLMIHQKAPHRNWSPGPQEVGLWKGHQFPEPANLFDDYNGRGPGAAHQEMEIDRHMHIHYDLHLPLTDKLTPLPKIAPDDPLGGAPGGLTEEQKALWKASYADENAAFVKNPPTGKDLVRWKYQRYMMDYLRCVKGVDRNLGRVMDYLRENNLDKNTIVIYSSDQGFFLGEHGWFDKRWIYEESLRMPFIIRWPGHIAAGSEQNAIIQNTDFMPTFLALAGVTLPKDIHGESIIPLLENNKAKLQEAAYYHYYEKGEHNVPRHVGIRTPRYTLAWFYQEKPAYWELYDREKDPSQMKSVYDDPAYAKTREELTAQLKALAIKYDDQTAPWGEKPPEFKGEAMP